MNRKAFIKRLGLIPLATVMTDLGTLRSLKQSLPNTPKMPVLFLGHGSPMNAIEENEFVSSFRKLGHEVVKPQAILCISAHWETRGTKVTAMNNPPTIHDFGGFPQALFDVQYPAPGSPELAKEAQNVITKTEVELDHHWGLDHGAWSVIKHMYPNADVPVIQLSLDYTKTPQYHYELARELESLRHKGVLIVGSGNVVHNLRRVAWDKLNDVYAWDWAEEANEKMESFIMDGNHTALIDYGKQGSSFSMSIPTPEHYLPLIYTLALKGKSEDVTLFNNKVVGGSIGMMSLKIA
ncbi:4,5-DOPA dioxygenase extradiol [Allomuricauda sp. NBRC 101325]|uniref:4,5-DOPA-extradiol-dioxygenase n=1 Tax=Allomuricauda sp. NBRC 101325 TaxID=1113758 RepID=UPI0024A36724|nr:4,5-DOPA dioxygenase extradiol [Muricauda sp. NBRC 101325]GLU44383.1 dioxygenase [Muricauda sp. NBRC 101325]